MLKNAVNSDIATYIPNFDIPFILSTDASNSGIGAALQQEYNNEIKVIDWASKKLTEA